VRFISPFCLPASPSAQAKIGLGFEDQKTHSRSELKMNARSFKSMGLVAALVVSGLVGVGCGGGGGTSAVLPPYTAPPVEPAARVLGSVPEPSYPAEPLRLAAFRRLQQIRVDAGVGVLKQHPSLDKAAQDHSKYQVINKISSHDEVSGNPGFTWEKSFARMNSAGYPTEQEGTTEVTIGPAYLPDVTQPELAAKLVDGLLSGPYHREAMLAAKFTDVGIGVYTQNDGINLNIDMAKTNANNNTQGAPNTPLIIWPPDKSTGLPTNLAGEEGAKGKPTLGPERGYPASVQTDDGFRSIMKVVKFELRGPDGALVDTELIRYGTLYAALPRKHLQTNTTYSVVFEGEIDEVNLSRYDPLNNQIRTKTWTFTTGQKLEY
jgi:uncharacterized protein YkwD